MSGSVGGINPRSTSRTGGACISAVSTFSFLEHEISFVTAAECPEGLVHHDCFHHSCEQTCTSIRSGQSSCPPLQVIPIHSIHPFQSGVCFPGCFCPSGLVREGDTCIEPSHCSNCVCRLFFNAQPSPSFSSGRNLVLATPLLTGRMQD